MGIKVRKKLTIGGGIEVPENSLVLCDVSIAIPILYRELENPLQPASEENQVIQKHRRIIRYNTQFFLSIDAWKSSDGKDIIFTKEIPAGWAKEITDEEYDLLIDNAAYAEVWLAEHFDELLGGDYCDVINALDEQ